jgi:hypothetical protein
MLDDHPEDVAAIEKQIAVAAKELLRRSRPRRWIKLMARVGYSSLTRTAGDSDVEVDPAALPIGPGLVGEIERWAVEHLAVLGDWPRAGGFESEQQAEFFVRKGEQLAARLQAELGAGYCVEYMPEPIRLPGVKLSRATE